MKSVGGRDVKVLLALTCPPVDDFIEANASTATIGNEAPPTARALNNKKMPVCRYFKTKSESKPDTIAAVDKTPEAQAGKLEETSKPLPVEGNQRIMAAPSRVVARPMPKAQIENPREFQINQIQRRFKPETIEKDDGSAFAFSMKPSDPDFPYEIDELHCVLTVPSSYPTSGVPTMKIQNKEIPRGFQINIERGFDAIVANNPGSNLLGMVNKLDRQLEAILAGRETETIKIIPNAKPALEAKQLPQATAIPPAQVQSSTMTFTSDQKLNAQTKRQADVRQLEARFSRLESFSRSADGLNFTLPLDSPKRSTWPESLQSIRSIRVAVPELYPLQPIELQLSSESPDARAIEAAFKQRSEQNPNSNITQQINYLSQNMKEMSLKSTKDLRSQPQEARITPVNAPQTIPTQKEGERSHLHYIARPPEWSREPEADSASDTEGTASTLETDQSDDEDAQESSAQLADEPTSTAPVERGILLSFPHLELHAIELLELSSLNIMVKCERCKDTMELLRLRSSSESSAARDVSCKKCAQPMAVRFRADMIHANSVRAGYLDLDGCTVVDMLPSQFIPTCSECSTSYPAPGVTAVRGDSAMAICRECHRRMSFRIQEVKFLQISAATIRASRAAPPKKKQRDNLGITAGTELPQQGRCSHYRKSYRWFRFSCCGKVFPCDRCHDEQTDHPNEFANRMLCGFCSREQNYRPDDCAICHAALTGKRGRGFWEGGKGTRDPAKMSRKDPRKYKRRPGTKPKT